MPYPDLSRAVATATANLDQEWSGARDVIFDLGLGRVEALCDGLARPDAAVWLRSQPDETVRLACILAWLAAGRLQVELIDELSEALDARPRPEDRP